MRKNVKKVKINKNSKIFLIIIIFSVIGFGIGTGVYFLFNNKSDVLDKPNNEVVKPPVIEEKVYEATLIGVGDNLIHSSLYKDANKHANYKGYDFKPMLTYIKEIVSEYDIAYYNQETILGGTEIGLSDYPTFNSPYEVGDAMIDAGFNLVSLATNHTVDRGKKAVTNSCNYWDKQVDVLTSGSYCSDESREEVRIAEVNNITYTMLNYTYGTNGMPVSDNYLVNVWPTNTSINNPDKDTKYQEYKEQVKIDVEKVRDKVDVLIVAMHWGVEYTHKPTVYEKDMAQYLASLGVDIIIGTHPHVIQPIEWIDDTLVIYSLGNFISAQYQNYSTCTNYKCTVGLMTSLRIEKTVKGEEVSIKIDNIENELIYNYYNQSSWRGFKVIPFSNPDIKKYLPNHKKVYETYKKVVQDLDSSMYVREVAE
jgi:poly-gamma-glutamate synthesis protein (capsule biosynthesis protein)